MLIRSTRNRPLSFPVLRAPPTAYAGTPGKRAESPQCAGTACVLIGAMQARNNARFLIAGSLEMFSDKFFDSGVKGSGVK